MPQDTADLLWVTLCAGLVFLMQSGFLCLEAGFTRSKNSINVALKNMTDFSVSILLFWFIGFALMFGATCFGLFGTTYFLLPIGTNPKVDTFFIFQAMFCATAATIVSGAVAERMRFAAYVIVATLISGLIYPIYGHWAWGGALGGAKGWLAELGFVDFAGSTVVHGIGGWAALAAVLAIGPRAGRFDPARLSRGFRSNNLSLAMLGALLIWLGWIGFNGGSTIAFDDRVPKIICNTFIAGAAGMLTALAVGRWRHRRSDVALAINGSLAGLVAITAGCHAVTGLAPVFIGAIGALLMVAAQSLLIWRRVDDAVGAIAVHGVAGCWGTIAVAFFADPTVLGTGLPWTAQLLIQLAGCIVAFVFTVGVVFLALKVINLLIPLRVTFDEEQIGLNVAEHGARSDLFELLTEMEHQRQSGDFSRKVVADPHTEVGQVAEQYNRVLDRVVRESENATRLTDKLSKSKDRIRQIVQNAPIAMVLVGDHGKIALANEQAEHTFGYRLGELLGRPFNTLLPPQSHKDDLAKRIAASADSPPRPVGETLELIGQRKNSTKFPLELACNSFGNDEVLIAMIDVSERKRIENEREEMHGQLLDASRQAGMAEVATGVLHNVGNVLNSVNVSARLMEERVRHGRASGLQKVCDLIQKHSDDLSGFFATSSQAQQLPSYLEKLTGKLLSEREDLLDEINSLTQNIDHIKEIVQTQQTYAKVGGIREKVSLADLVDDAVKINDAGLLRHGVELVCQYNVNPIATINKHKVLQILINLISNAKYAVSDSDNEQKRVTLRIDSVDTDGVKITIEDTGVGIAKENLRNIFTHGFTTKKEGHGFGLHSCALAAKELGGSISVQSEGLGRGATFTLVLPLDMEGASLCETPNQTGVS